MNILVKKNSTPTADLNDARFFTPLEGEAAQVVGQLSSPMNGRVNVLAKLGPTGAGQNGNYLVDWTWSSIGYAHVTQPYSQSPVYYYVGTTSTVYGCVTVSAVTTTGGDDTYNDVLADAVYYNFPI